MAADPGRPVVLDSDGLVVALGPLIRDAFVHCRARHDCIVLLDHHSYGERDDRKVEAVGPDPSGFRPGRTPTFYPEHEKEMYGFKPVELTFADSWVAWTVPFRRAPIIATTFTTMFAVLGFGSGWMLAPAWRVRTEFSSRAAGYVAFLAAWTTASAVVVVFILLLVVLALWLDGSVFNLRPLLVVLFAAFPLGVAYAYVRTVRPSLARQSGNSV